MKEYIDVLPTNVNQVQSVSYHNGNPLVEFKIGAQERYTNVPVRVTDDFQ